MPALALGAFALRLASAFRSWSDPVHGQALTYFAGNCAHHGGDELRLRASLIKDHLLEQGFGYARPNIEIEAVDRSDVVLYAGSATDRRPVAIVETKRSGFPDLLNTRLATGETAPQQLARYVRLRGLYLGALTDGNTWHFFDFGVSLQPRASITLTTLTELLTGSTTPAQAEAALTTNAAIQNALVVAQDMMEADKWTAVDGYLGELNDPRQFKSTTLTTADARAGLVTQINERLGLLRDTIVAQFAVLKRDLDTYNALRVQVSATDTRPYAEELDEHLDLLTSTIADADRRAAFLDFTRNLVVEYAETGDADWFYATYMVKAPDVLAYHQAALPGIAAPTASGPVPVPNADRLLALITTHFAYVTQLAEAYEASVRLQRAYAEWQRRVRGVYADPAREFCLQTGYIHFVRLFFVRVCEDYELIQRRISNGPFGRFNEYRRALLTGVSDVYTRLLQETFDRAANVYHNFFNRADLYDWFKLDERSILGILAVMNRYDFSKLDFDLLGNIYNEGYIEAQRRSEHGQFYTPHAVVQYMVNSLGLFPSRDPADPSPLTDAERASVNRSVIDISCGSGSFLVEIAARKATILQRMVDSGLIKPVDAIERIVDTLAGIDLSPFACYLAEINLIIRCMPFLRESVGRTLIPRSIDRMHVYCGDALEPTRRERVQFHEGASAAALGTIIAVAEPVRLSDEERLLQFLKDRKATPGRLMKDTRGFAVVIGNPPYVKANESQENSTYRDQIRSWGVYPIRDKWDLFIPFVYRNLEFLADDGWMILTTTSAVETEGYAKPLRAELARLWVEQIDFFPRLKLFGKDVGVFSTIFHVQKREASNPAIRRRTHTEPDATAYAETTMDQALGPDAFFRATYAPPPPGIATCCVPLCAITYIGTGLVAHSQERLDTIVSGKRVKAFGIDDSFRLSRDGLAPAEAAHFTDRGVLGAEVQPYHLTQKRYVAYDHMQSQLYRARIPELFRTPQKLLLGETSGGYYDTDQLFANHSVQVVVPWQALTVDEPGVKKVRKTSMAMSGYDDLDTIAAVFDLRYVLAVINSDYMRRYLLANQAQGTREGRIYPDVWKQMPVKVVDSTRQATIGTLVDEIQSLQQALQGKRHERDVFDIWQRDGKLTGKLTDYTISGMLTVIGALAQTRKRPYTRSGQRVILFEHTGIEVTDPAAIPLLDYFCWYCNMVQEEMRGYPWETMRDNIPLPGSLTDIAACMAEVAAVRQDRANAATAIAAKQAEIEQAVIDAYDSGCAESLWQTIQGLRSATDTAVALPVADTIDADDADEEQE
ncbi:SAM-dependent DNA methyltransferase [Chloroflexales bacterium ZM16-3]|nr:SAM-dependent DNA methyltransferase [Chloroflexales bacterium ZM16-3]